MNNELQQYLSKVDHYLKDVSPLDRSKIILEISEKVEQSSKDYPDKTIHQVLEDLGSPVTLANHYRIDKGLKTFKEEKPFSFFKFLLSVIIFFTLLTCVLGAIVVWKFTPVFEIDEKTNHVTILGGLIDINGKTGRVKIKDHYQYYDNQYTNSFEGSMDILSNEFDELVINFKSGILNLKYTDTEKLSWTCKLETPPKEDFINKSKQIVELDFEELEGISCDITIPSNLKLTVDGNDGRVDISEPLSDVYIELSNGSIVFTPNPEADYKYEINLDEGTSAQFDSSQSPSALEINLTLKNGTILKGQD